MRHIGLFEGIGGFSLAARWSGWETIAWCEWNEFGQKVLRHHFPKAKGHGDITKTDFTIYRGQCDILTGGFPCQPYSGAGKRLGKEDERHLWPEMLRAIKEVQPRWVVGENVLGLVNWSGGLVFHEVQTDLEAAGYEVFPYVLPACAVNAPHRRDRVWFVAYSDKCTARPSRTCGKAESNGSKNHDEQSSRGKQTEQHNRCSDVSWVTTDTNSIRQGGRHEQRKPNEQRHNIGRNSKNDVANAKGGRLEGYGQHRYALQSSGNIGAICDSSGVGTNNERPRAWERFPETEPAIRGGNDGIPCKLDGITVPKWRNESIKAYGNAIVPQVAFEIFQAINEYEATCRPLI